MTERRGDRELRADAQSLRPTVHVGRDGVTPDVVAELARQLKAREVVKVRLLGQASDDRNALARELADKASAELVEVRGRTVVLSRRRCGEKGHKRD
jgi:RNA-binding protein